MKLAGNKLMFGEGCLTFLAQLDAKKATIVIGGHSMEKSGNLDKVKKILEEKGIETSVVRDVEPDPCFETVLRGAKEMLEFKPDAIIALGGGSVMDAAKTMWIYYEHPELKTIQDILPPNAFPKLREKAIFVCIPSTAGTASEVSRSVVISDSTGMKHGIGNMEMMPDLAICDPEITMTMPAKITAETGLDALTHALEALASTRANYLSDILSTQAAIDIINNLPLACKNGNNLKVREKMLNASMVAGLAFTNVSLGIVHSMAHTVGSYFHTSHGLGDAIILPYIIRYNSQNNAEAKKVYDKFVKALGRTGSLEDIIFALNEEVHIPKDFSSIIKDRKAYVAKLDIMSACAKADGCTKTNPVIPELDQFKELFLMVYPEN
jgi:alcohol dehydrogenase class IV